MPRVTPHVNYGLWMRIRQCGSISYIKGTTLTVQRPGSRKLGEYPCHLANTHTHYL